MLMLVTTGVFSQQRDLARKERAQVQMSSEERAVLASKRMALALDLTEAQRLEIEKLHLERVKEREAMIAERQKIRKDMAARRYARLNKNLDKRMEQQEKMKEILTEEQYKKWKDSQERPEKKSRAHMKKKTI
jgi:periplasmic protein CpxP/Spy